MQLLCVQLHCTLYTVQLHCTLHNFLSFLWFTFQGHRLIYHARQSQLRCYPRSATAMKNRRNLQQYIKYLTLNDERSRAFSLAKFWWTWTVDNGEWTLLRHEAMCSCDHPIISYQGPSASSLIQTRWNICCRQLITKKKWKCFLRVFHHSRSIGCVTTVNNNPRPFSRLKILTVKVKQFFEEKNLQF